ncbi:MAG: sodium-dependent transporter [Defluviitaleaceae bacterium]|nr:sodium-dependent transporter [Defluviitaleaceae bacterium]
MQEREKFSSRLSFIIVSVSCAVGLGNIWLMPYRAGAYGGAIYIALVIAFIFLFAIPILVTEFAIGRASGKSVANHFQILEPKNSKWHLSSYFMISGNYILMMFYTIICGFTIYYFWQAITGNLAMDSSVAYSQQAFESLTQNPIATYITSLIVLIICFLVCFLGLKNGVEKITKYMMIIFFALLLVLIVRSLTLPGAMYGIRFLFIPNIEAFLENNPIRVLHMALGQAVFSVSVGMGSMAVFGSYINKEKRLFKDAFTVGFIDISTSILCLLMILPAAIALGINPGAGEGLLFVTMPNLFYHMPFSTFFSIIFYTGLMFVAISTAIAVIENIVAIGVDKLGFSRKKSIIINFVLMCILILPASFGRNIWSSFNVTGFPHIGSFFTFIVMEIILPLGSLIYVLFCTSKRGFGWKKFKEEVNTGVDGWEISESFKFYLSWIVPIAMIFIFGFGMLQRFTNLI